MILPLRRPAIAVACLAITLAAACAPTEVDTTTPRNPDARVGGAATIGILRPDSIDPGNAFDPASELVVETICDTLIGVDPLTGELVPGLAESWAVRGEGSRFLLRLREGAVFHDGRPVTARDVVYSLNRMVDPEFAGRAASLLAEVSGFGELRGSIEANDDLDRQRLRGVREASGNAVEIFLTVPNADWLATLTHPATSPVSMQAAEADAEAFREQPTCAGPYRVTEPWTSQSDSIKVTRFDGYYAEHGGWSGGGAGYLDDITFTIVPDSGEPPVVIAAPEAAAPGTAVNVADYYDAIERATSQPQVAPPRLDDLDVVGVPAWRWDEFRGRRGVLLVTATGAGVDYVGIPLASLSGGDESVDRSERASEQLLLRRALSLALDRQGIVDGAFFGGRVPATSMVPESAGGNASCPWTPTRADAVAARQALDDAGIEVGAIELELLYSTDFANEAMVEAIAEQWRDVLGLDVAPRGVPFPQFVQEMGGSSASVGAFRTSWSVPVPSRDAYLFDLFHSSQSGQGNLEQFADFFYDELLTEDARQADDATDRGLLYDQAEQIVCDQIPLIPVAQQLLGYAVSGVESASGQIAAGHNGRIQTRELTKP